MTFVALLFSLIILVLLVGVGWWAITQLASIFGLPQQIIGVLKVLLVVAGALYFCGIVAGYAPPVFSWHR